jgi:hypothetical protein
VSWIDFPIGDDKLIRFGMAVEMNLGVSATLTLALVKGLQPTKSLAIERNRSAKATIEELHHGLQ